MVTRVFWAPVTVRQRMTPEKERSAFYKACKNGSLGLAREILQRATQSGERHVLDLLMQRDEKERTPLIWTIKKGHTKIAALLLEFGSNPDTADQRGTPLHYAVWKGNGEAVDLLLCAGACPWHEASSGLTPLDLAIAIGHDPIARALCATADVVAKVQVQKHRLLLPHKFVTRTLLVFSRHLRGFDGLVRRQAYVIRDGCRVSKMGSAWLDSLRGMSKNLVSSNLGVVPQLCLRFADSSAVASSALKTHRDDRGALCLLVLPALLAAQGPADFEALEAAMLAEMAPGGTQGHTGMHHPAQGLESRHRGDIPARERPPPPPPFFSQGISVSSGPPPTAPPMDAYPLFPPPPVLDPVDALLGASPGVGAYCGSSDHAVPFIPIGGGDPSAHEDLSRHLSLRQEPSVPSLFTPRQGGGAPSTREAAKESKGAEGVGAPRLRCSHASPAVSLGASPTSEGSLLDLPVERPPAMPVVCLSAAVGPGALSTGAQGREGGGVGVEECALIDMEGFESSAGAKRMEREREDSVADEEAVCLVCRGARADTGLLHGDTVHRVCCSQCAETLMRSTKTCPVCRAEFQKAVRVF